MNTGSGKIKYQQDIDAYFGVYDKIMAAGEDKPLVFKSWLNPSKNDRNFGLFLRAHTYYIYCGKNWEMRHLERSYVLYAKILW
jgi:hypothetical protein